MDNLSAATTNELLTWFGLVVPVLTAAVTGFFAYRIGNKKEASKTETALHAGFKILIDELQAERSRLAERLSKLIDAGNVDLVRELNERFKAIEDQIEHNRRNADHNFGIINEIIQERIPGTDPPPPMRSKRKVPIVPQRLSK